MRIQESNVTVKAFQHQLQDAYRKDDVRLVWHTSVLLDLLTHRASARPVSMPGRKPLCCPILFFCSLKTRAV